MNSRLLRAFAGAALTIGCATTAWSDTKTPHWAYHGHHGNPAQWGELDQRFEACAKGTQQSPIDIRNTVRAELPALDFQYGSVSPTLVNNGHTVQVNVAPGQSLTVGDKRYELLQFHFHTPSEESVGGKRAAMVAHFVHRDAAGHLGVVAVLMQQGATNAAYQPLFKHLPRAGETITVEGLSLDLAQLLPQQRGYYAYEGSLTTPPCTEGVHWHVLKQPVKLGAEQIKAFRRLFNANARPLQPIHGRAVRESL